MAWFDGDTPFEHPSRQPHAEPNKLFHWWVVALLLLCTLVLHQYHGSMYYCSTCDYCYHTVTDGRFSCACLYASTIFRFLFTWRSLPASFANVDAGGSRRLVYQGYGLPPPPPPGYTRTHSGVASRCFGPGARIVYEVLFRDLCGDKGSPASITTGISLTPCPLWYRIWLSNQQRRRSHYSTVEAALASARAVRRPHYA
jgi:hypothetical protein